LLAEVVFAVVAAHSVGVAPDKVLPKFGALSPEAYTSVMVALGRKELWEPAAKVARWCREQGLLLPARSYVLLSRRRWEEGLLEQALEPLEWMRELGCEPSGAAVEALAQLAALPPLRLSSRSRIEELVAWIRTRDAGRALWHQFVPSAAQPNAAVWRSQGLAIEAGDGAADDMLRGSMAELRSVVAPLMQERPDDAGGG
jgi:hypothetical protein